MVDADLAVRSECLYQLLGSAAQVMFILRNWLVGHLDLAAAGEEYLLRVATSLGGQAQDVVISCSQLSRSNLYEIGEPGITVLRCAPLSMNAFASNPDGDAWLLHWLGVESQVLEAVELAVEADVLFRPQTRDNLKLLIGHAAAILEWDA